MAIQNIIQGILQDDKKKKILIIALVVFFILAGILVFFSTRPSNAPQAPNDQLMSDIALLAPRSNATTTSIIKLAPIINLSADHETVAPGQPVKITWSAENATTCTNSTGDTLDLSGSFLIAPKDLYTFDITCSGPKGTDIQSVTIAVTSAPIINLSAAPMAVFSGQPSLISWNTTNADRCVDAMGNTLRLNGNMSISPKTAYTFNMSCTGSKGTTKKSITVGIARPLAINTSIDTSGKTIITPDNTSGDSTTAGSTTAPSVVLSVDSPDIAYNTATTIRWNIKNVTYCVFTSDGSIGSLPPFVYSSGSQLTSKLTKTQAFTLSCVKGTEKASTFVTIAVGGKPALPDPGFESPFKLYPAFAATYAPITASWKASSAKSCALNRDGVAVPGKSLLSPSTSVILYEKTSGAFTYTLVCTGPDGAKTTSSPITVTVIDCQFQNGFGNGFEGTKKPEEVINGTVELIDGSAVCTYTYGGTDWSWDKFSKIFNLGPVDPRGVQSAAPGAFQRLSTTTWTPRDLCQYTYYTQKIVNGALVTKDYFDTLYHPRWKMLLSTPESHNVTTHYNQTGSCGAVSYNCTQAHDVTTLVTGVNMLKCQVLP